MLQSQKNNSILHALRAYVFLQRQHLKLDTFIFFAKFVTWYPCFLKNIQKDMLTFILLEKNEIMLLTYEKMEEEWFCFIQGASFHIVDKRLIQPRSVSTWSLLYPTSVNESRQRLAKFICGFRKCHSVCSNISEVSFVTTLLILMLVTR